MKHTYFLVATALLLGGCGLPQPPLSAAGALLQTRALSAVSSDTFLYYADGAQVFALSYPQGKLVGTLSELDQPQGVCSDAQGDVFITTRYTEAIYEYAHGGSDPIAKLEDYGYYPLGCAVDPVTGNLAVANPESMNGGEGNVAIYTGAKGKPTFYSALGVNGYSWPAYDTDGNLYVNASALIQMPYGSQSVNKISLDVGGQGIQWDGKYLAMIDGPNKKIYRIAVSGSSGTVVSTVSFNGLFTELGEDFVLPSGAVVAPYGSERAKSNRIGQWSYPKGGTLKKNIHEARFVQSMTLSSGSLGKPARVASNAVGSWVRHTTSSSPLIYTNGNEETVLIYDYAGNQVGDLGGFELPGGLCSDAGGDVFVTDPSRELVYEYQGGSLPTNVIDDRPYEPNSCAVDPTTGNLAITNLSNVAILPPGSSSTPVIYTAPNIESYAFATYDGAGNLYVDGTSSKHGLAFAALDKGSQTFLAVPLNGLGNRRHRAAGVQWDGQYVAVGDSLSGSIYRVSVSGSSGTVVQTIKVRGWFRHYPVEFAIAGKKLLFPNPGKLLFFNYPKGGKKTGGFLGSVGSDITVTGAY